MSLKNFVGNWTEIYLIGGSRRAAFEVLLPIGYLLLLAIPVIEISIVVPVHDWRSLGDDGCRLPGGGIL